VPTLDRQAGVPGLQTAQIVAASVQTDTGTLGSGQGTTTPVTVLQATPTVVTNASPDFALSTGQLSDIANVSGLVSPSPAGNVTFRLYGPTDPSCADTPVFIDIRSLTVGADPTAGTATSAAFTPTEAGTYRWVATYNGDVNNASVSGTCGDSTESRVVAQATPAIATDASLGVTLGGGQLSDRATVTGLVNPIGPQSVRFDLYGPADAVCAGPPVFTSTVPLTNGTAQSAAFTPVDVGTYRWVATYNGDVNNASVSGTCGDATESRVVAQATPAIVTLASAGITFGTGQLSDQATVTGLVNPVGAQSVTFRLFGPNDGACSSSPVFTSTVALTNGSAQSAGYTPTVAGTYRWIASYNGDANNAPVAGRCDDPTETRTVASPPATLPPTQPTLPPTPPTLPPTGGGVDVFVSLALCALMGGWVLLAATRPRAR
jgi:hypothetical protein